MRCLREAWQGVQRCGERWLWILSLLLLGLGARLWLIQQFGTPLPFWDQWEEARVVYLPFFAGNLSLPDLFSPHNEHRIFFTRIYGLVLLLLNGQWDGQLQMVGNALVHGFTMAALGALMCRWLEKKCWLWVWLPLVLVLALPFGWENSLAGFQSQFYFLLAFSLLTLWLLGLHAFGSVLWWCGAATALMALFTVASGLLAAAAVFALSVLRIVRTPGSWRSQAPTLALCAAVVLTGFLLQVSVPHHRLLQAHSAGDFLSALGANLAWPWIVVPPFALLNLLPLLVLAWTFFRQKRDDPATELTLAIGLWTLLQAAATAYARGAEGRPPGWRYMDSTSFILLANCFSIPLLLGRIQRGRPWMLAGIALWALACAAGLALLTARAWRIDIPERHLYHRAQLQHARAFLATDDIHVFDRKPKSQLLCYQGDPLAPPLAYEAQWTVDYLRNAVVRSILPACARLPLPVAPDPTATHGFATNSVRLVTPDPPTELSWGSYSARGAAAMGFFRSLPIRRSQFPYLQVPIAGDLGAQDIFLGLAEEVSRRPIAVGAASPPGNRWLDACVKAPAGAFEILAQDSSHTGWLGFKAPREMGCLSFWTVRFLGGWKYLLFAGLGLFLFNLAALLIARQRSKEPGPKHPTGGPKS